MRIINASDVNRCFPVSRGLDADEIITCIEEALRSQADAQVPMRVSTASKHHKYLYMPAHANETTAIKIVAVPDDSSPAGLPATTLVFDDAGSGAALAAINSSELTAIRTAAASALSAIRYSRSESHNLLICGAGRQAFWHAILLTKSAKGLEERLIRALGNSLEISTARQPGIAIPQADLLALCTPSKKDLFDVAHLKSGAHIMAIGSYTPEMREVDLERLLSTGRLRKIQVDSLEACLAEAGELQFLKTRSHADVVRIVEEVATAQAADRGDVTAFKSVGSACMDVAIARLCVTRAQRLGLGFDVQF